MYSSYFIHKSRMYIYIYYIRYIHMYGANQDINILNVCLNLNVPFTFPTWGDIWCRRSASPPDRRSAQKGDDGGEPSETWLSTSNDVFRLWRGYHNVASIFAGHVTYLAGGFTFFV